MKAYYEKVKYLPNVVGVGHGFKTTKGVRTGELAAVVYVTRKYPEKFFAPHELIPATIDGTKTDVVQVGKVRALALTDKCRPLKLGYSVGQPSITAGTIGGIVGYQGRPAILSNNHVLAASNAGIVGDPIHQPGPYDQAAQDDYRVGELVVFQPVSFLGGEIPVDCNIAKFFVWAANLFLKMDGHETRLVAVKAAPLASNLVDAALAFTDQAIAFEEDCRINRVERSALGELVWKRGRTTEQTNGSVDQADVTIQVQYGEGKIALFTDQVLSSSLKSAGGDSGSGIRSASDPFTLKGLLFAGSEEVTVWNQADNVQAALGFTL